MMQAKVEGGNQGIGADGHRSSASAVYAQPWWQGYGNTDNSLTGIGERGLRSTSEHMNVVTVGALSVSNAINVSKDIPSGIALRPDGYNGQDQATTSENPSDSSQREFITIMTSYPYQDPSYGAIIPPYGQQSLLVPSHSYGVHQARMLRLEMEEEPVYVNAKQYDGIMRRRQIRAKAELEKKIIKNRKPYLHESRHQHAMRRARGCGGRFLNTKKLSNETNKSMPDSEGTQDNGAISSVSGNLPNNSSGYLYPVTEPRSSSFPRGTSTAHNIVSFGNNDRNNRHLRSSGYLQSQPGEMQAYSSQHMDERMQMTSPSPRAFPIT